MSDTFSSVVGDTIKVIVAEMFPEERPPCPRERDFNDIQKPDGGQVSIVTLNILKHGGIKRMMG